MLRMTFQGVEGVGFHHVTEPRSCNGTAVAIAEGIQKRKEMRNIVKSCK